MLTVATHLSRSANQVTVYSPVGPFFLARARLLGPPKLRATCAVRAATMAPRWWPVGGCSALVVGKCGPFGVAAALAWKATMPNNIPVVAKVTTSGTTIRFISCSFRLACLVEHHADGNPALGPLSRGRGSRQPKRSSMFRSAARAVHEGRIRHRRPRAYPGQPPNGAGERSGGPEISTSTETKKRQARWRHPW